VLGKRACCVDTLMTILGTTTSPQWVSCTIRRVVCILWRTAGIDYKNKVVELDDMRVKLQIW